MKNWKCIFLSIFISSSAFAESIFCKAVGKGTVREMHIIRHPHEYEPQWFEAWITPRGFFKKKQKMNLSPLYFAGDRMLLIEFEGSPERTMFHLDMPNVSRWHRQPQAVTLRLYKGSKNEEAQVLSCRADQPLRFVNYCERSTERVLEILSSASRAGNANLVEMILSCEPEVNVVDKKGCTPLMYAVDSHCGSGHFDDYSSLATNTRILNLLISKGAFVDIADPVSGATPLLKSSWGGDLSAIKSFLDMEADVDAQDRDGYTPLMRAISRGHKKAVELILKYRPQLEMINNVGQTAEMIAHGKGYHDIAMLLRKPDMTVKFNGEDSGACTVNANLRRDKLVVIELQATENKMFLLTIPDLGVELMANPGEHLSMRVLTTKSGRYEYQCGIHGGQNVSRGVLVVD